MRKWALILAAGLMFALAPARATAWNKPGHMVTGAIAYEVLQAESPQTIAKVIALLKEHPYYETKWEPLINRPFVPEGERDL